MDDYPTEFNGQLGAMDGPHSQECVSELHDVAETLKQRLLEARNYAEEELRMKALDKLLNQVLLGAGATAYINKFATSQPVFRLYPSHTTLVAGVNDVFRTISNGTFTSGTFLSVFAAPSFPFLVLQGVIDACLSVPPFVVAAAIFGKWALGHFAMSANEDRGAQVRPLRSWPKHVQARILSWLFALHTILALSQILYCICWLAPRHPLVVTCAVMVFFLGGWTLYVVCITNSRNS
ncbi:uncharacterized protein EDB91DRAFT_1133000 [Suillus paluster]|uniref:uncharacterized protein n=1 Tax=Suillus paluster TaxID=48578 RepID=UPI001B883FB4|nr:uncharacterized protein EDB91DRAFT_1133000 [Suillus paluster]KAG1740532.1 hypothetical protein EDB91DRAFT_1133000 [Suillus paluster]